MEYLETISKMALAGLGVWRLTRNVHTAFSVGGAPNWGQPSVFRVRPEDLLGSRVMDFLYWIGVWMSAQTALWVACGLCGVLLNWLLCSGVARLLLRSKTTVVKGNVLANSPAISAISKKASNGAVELCL